MEKTGNPLLNIINTAGKEAKPNPAPSTKPAPGNGTAKIINPPKGTIKVPFAKYVGGKK